MIVKLTLAGCLLVSGLGMVAPLAIAASGADTCVATPTEPLPADCQPPTDPDAQTGINTGTVAGELAGADEAVARALRLVGGHGYYQLCARLAANIWGRPRSGYFSAAEQWRHMVATGNAHRGDRRPPVGALVFWETGGPYGHVAVYVGNGRVVSNDINDRVPGEGGVYLVDVGLIESKWGATYLGWAPPIYSTN
ncbi:CHAP domain-containing protein [Kribbella sp. NPDC050820]|uniref:CHAP domain-containing protein n=1 Tax=Kribbella sp. NPDC050820 TaxID=3155408 RepID=UPI0033F61E08